MKNNKNCTTVSIAAIAAIAGVVILSGICIKHEPALIFIVFPIAGYIIAGIAGTAGGGNG